MSHDSFSKREYKSSLIKYLLFLVPPSIVAIVLLWFSTLRLWQVGISSTLAAGFIIGCLFLPFIKFVSRIFEKIFERFFGSVTSPLLKKIFNFRRGYEGEEIVLSWFSKISGDWILIPNNEYIDEESARFFDIDLIAIGERGIFVIEIKNYSNILEFTEDKCFIIFPNESKRLAWSDPRRQVERNADFVDEILQRNGITLKSRKIVVSARAGSIKFNGKPGLYIADSKESLEKYLMLDINNYLTNEEILKIVKVLRATGQ